MNDGSNITFLLYDFWQSQLAGLLKCNQPEWLEAAA